MRGGTLCPHIQKIPNDSSVDAPNEVIFRDFVPFNILLVLLKSFFKKRLKILKN